jgi:UDP-N-acetyl-D-mannosaminuronate dehydrogenase
MTVRVEVLIESAPDGGIEFETMTVIIGGDSTEMERRAANMVRHVIREEISEMDEKAAEADK